MKFIDSNGVTWTIKRDPIQPRWWIAAHPDGWHAAGVDAQTRRDALAQIAQLDSCNLL